MSTETLVCSGCGAALQSETESEPGYVPQSAVNRDNPVCRRCFRIRHYGEFSRLVVSPDVYSQQVSKILEEPGLVLYVLDVFDLAGSFVSGLARYIGDSRVIVVVNKVDLLPREVHPEYLDRWVRDSVIETGITPEDVMFISAQSSRGIDHVIEAISDSKADKVYVVGMANVGKSTMLNRVIGKVAASEPFTVSRVPGTTLGLVGSEVTLPSGRSVDLVDTPGLVHGNRMTDKLCADCLKVAVPQSRVNPKVYQLNPGQSLWLGGFARFDFIEGSHQPIVCYASNSLVIHRTKLEKAEHIGREHSDDILKAPCPECRVQLGDPITFPVAIGRYAKTLKNTPHLITGSDRGCDIVLAGLGWIALSGADLRALLWVPRGVEVSVRPRLIGELTSGSHRTSRPTRRRNS